MSGPRSSTSVLILWLALLVPVAASAAGRDGRGAPSEGPGSAALVAAPPAERALLRGSGPTPDVDVALRDGAASLADGRGRFLGLLTGVLLGIGLWLTRRRLGD